MKSVRFPAGPAARSLVFGVSVAVLALQAGAAAAADDWTGIYAGVHGAYLFGDNDWTGDYVANPGALPDEITFAEGAPNAAGTNDMSGWLGGVSLGADKQFDRIVVGIVGDSSWGDLSGDGPIPGSESRSITDIDWIGTLRGRIGYAGEGFLAYATGGGALAKGTNTITGLSSTRGDVSRAVDYAGYVVGAGIEVPVKAGLTLQAEYLHFMLDADQTDFGTINEGRLQLYGDNETSLNLFKLGLNYRF